MTLVRALAIIAFVGVSIPGAVLAAPSEAPAVPAPTPAPRPPPPTYAQLVDEVFHGVQPRLDACLKVPVVPPSRSRTEPPPPPPPPEHGSVKLSIVVAPSGAVQSTSVVTSTLSIPVTGCIFRAVKELQFPPPPSKAYTIEHTFTVPNLVYVGDRPLPVLVDKYRAVLDKISIADCKKPGGPTGQGKVKLEIGATGEVFSSKIVPGPPYENTAVGLCVAAHYHHAIFATDDHATEYVYTFDLK